MPNLERRFLWTAIPAGRAIRIDGHQEPMALLSVLLTPRLLGTSMAPLTVSSFALQNWPQRLGALRFKVFRGTQEIPTYQVPYLGLDGQPVTWPPADGIAAWRALFPGDLPVRSHTSTSFNDRDTIEFPAEQTASEVRRMYSATARTYLTHNGDAPESNGELRAALRRVSAGWYDTVGDVGAERESAGPSAVSAGSALDRAYSFYRRKSPQFTALTQADLAAPQPEFHETVVQLADQPLLMRMLGLIVDLAVPAAQLAGSTNTTVRVVPSWPNPDSAAPSGWNNATQQDISPTTAYTLNSSRFVPASIARTWSTEFAQGMLPLRGAGLAPSQNPRFEIVPFDVDGAALRIVAAAQGDRAELDAGVTPSGALPALRSMGFALIERDRTAEHTRRVKRAAERASTQGLLATPLTADSLLGGYRIDILDVASGRWLSLCQRRVQYKIAGAAVGPTSEVEASAGFIDEGFLRPDPVTTGEGANDALYVHQAIARWDGWSLAVQRPERTVDTGDAAVVPEGVQPFETEVDVVPGTLPRLRFGRVYRLRARIVDLAGGGLRATDVDPSDVQRTEEFTHRRYEPLPPPELVPIGVFRDGETHDRLIIRSDRDRTAAQYAQDHGIRSFDMRLIFPPKTSLELALQFEGAFDSALGPDAAQSEVERLYEVGTRVDRTLRDVAGAAEVGANPQSGVSAPYFVVPEATTKIPWLPDPATRHIVLNARPRPTDPETGNPGEITGNGQIATWRGPWPDPLAKKLVLREASSGCTVRRLDDHAVLEVSLGPAEQVTIDIPACPRTNDVQLFGVAEWAGARPTDPADPLTKLIIAGKNPLITPPRTVTLVHAVQRPLADLGGRIGVDRAANATFAAMKTEALTFHIPSTGRLDVTAEWTDRDDLEPEKPVSTPRQAFVGSSEVKHEKRAQALTAIRHEFGDTRYRRVKYTVTAISRYEDCFQSAVAAKPDACRISKVMEPFDVDSTARPPVPKMLYTMPTFRWQQTVDGQGNITRYRYAGGVRVFLARPWFVTGDEEALAVLVADSGSASTDGLSICGRDPIWTTAVPPAVLTRSHFNTTAAGRIEVPELERALPVVPFGVEFDEEGNRWYADIDLSPLAAMSYFPFVRLALARYQPHTIPGVPPLSPPVYTEAIQLPPHRQLGVTRTPTNVGLLLTGRAPEGPRPNVVRSELQVRDTATMSSDETGWKTVGRASAGLGQRHGFDLPSTGGRPTRVVVREYEAIDPVSTDSGSTVTTGRLVYADIVPLAATSAASDATPDSRPIEGVGS